MKWLFIGPTAVLIGIGSAMAQPPPDYAPIPPPRVEVTPPPPREHVVWEPGHWHWDGVRYVWIEGHYIEREPRFAHYAEGRWVWGPREGRYIWVPAHWE